MEFADCENKSELLLCSSFFVNFLQVGEKKILQSYEMTDILKKLLK